MPTINQLTAVDAVAAGDLLAVYSQTNGDARKSAISVLQAYMQNNLTGLTSTFVTQYAAPSAAGFNVTITDGGDDDESVHLILTPTGALASGTITLPAVANVIDKQEVLINCTQAVTTLTVAGNGATAVTGEPSTLAANDYFRLKYDLVTKTWYRVG